ncbi:MAG: GTPase HflX [Clostridia bacterium]|nr:GTPase HflX [Clostridia bacterium]
MEDIEQRAILVGVSFGRDEYDIEESMNELKELTLAANAEVAGILIQNKERVDATFFIGKGKVEEVREACVLNDANLVIFNDELSGAQIRNLEQAMDVKVIDRTALILDIFAVRAKTRIAKLQVELAQLRYRLPRLQGLGQSMSRTGAGIGTRGPGEQKLELDRRRIRERITEIQQQIKEANQTRQVQRVKRDKNEIPIVAVVGYTNAGKSTIMNKILEMTNEEDVTEKQVFAKNMLFATLDTYSRRISLDENRNFILVDTVGFVSKLPHSLVEAFKATLEEVNEADLLIHVVDASNEHQNMQMTVTHRVLDEIGAGNKKMLFAYNKIDLVDHEIDHLKEGAYQTSAVTGMGLDGLIQGIVKEVFNDIVSATFLVPFDQGRILSELCNAGKVLSTDYLETGTKVRLELHEKDYNKYKNFSIGE